MIKTDDSAPSGQPAAVIQSGVQPGDEASVRLEIQHSNTILRAELVADLVAQYQAGHSLAGLGRAFDIHEQTVRAHLDRQHVALRPQAVLTVNQAEQVVTRYLAGTSLRALSREFDVSAGSIRNYVLRAGVPMRPAIRTRRQAASD